MDIRFEPRIKNNAIRLDRHFNFSTSIIWCRWGYCNQLKQLQLSPIFFTHCCFFKRPMFGVDCTSVDQESKGRHDRPKRFLRFNPIGSMVLVYMLTWLGYIDGIYVSIYSIYMDHHGSYGNSATTSQRQYNSIAKDLLILLRCAWRTGRLRRAVPGCSEISGMFASSQQIRKLEDYHHRLFHTLLCHIQYCHRHTTFSHTTDPIQQIIQIQHCHIQLCHSRNITHATLSHTHTQDCHIQLSSCTRGRHGIYGNGLAGFHPPLWSRDVWHGHLLILIQLILINCTGDFDILEVSHTFPI